VGKNDFIDLLLNKTKRNYEKHGMLGDFFDEIINDQTISSIDSIS
jgi:hypothetical protein